MGDFISDVESILNGGTWDKCGSQPPYEVGKLSKEDIPDFGYRIDALADQTRQVCFDNTVIAEKQRGVVQAWSITKTERDNIETDILGIMQASNDVYKIAGISRSTHLDRYFTTVTIERLAVVSSWTYSYMAGGIEIKTPFTIYDDGTIVFAITSNTGTPTDNYVLIWDNVNQCLKWASTFDADAIHDNVSGEINALTEKASPVDADLVIIEDSAASYAKRKVQLSNLPGGGGGGGEANTASNQGVGGVGLYDAKVGVDLQFRNVNAGSNKITITLDGGNKEVDIDVVQGNIDHNSLLNYAANRHFLESEINLANINEKNHASLANVSANQHHAQVHDNADHSTNYLANLVEDLTPQLGGDLDLNQKCIELDPSPTADHTANGLMTKLTYGETIALFDVLYMKSDGKLWKADADAEVSSIGIYLALEAGSADQTKKVLMLGFARDDSWTWTVGGQLFLSTTAGGLTQTRPPGTGDIIIVLGVAKSATIIDFRPTIAYIEHE